MISPGVHLDRVPALEPYVSALRAYWNGDTDARIRLRSSLGEDEPVPVAVFFREGEDLFWFDRHALDLCRGTVLDLGAGSGVHSLELQSRGHDVLAIENCAGLVELMRERGVRRALRADFRWWRGPRFDTVLMLMNGIGPTGTLGGLDRFLGHARSFLAPGGQLLLDSAAAIPEGAPVATDAWPPAGEYAGQAWIDLEFEGRRGLPFRELYADMDTVRDRAAAAGWKSEVASEGEGAFLLRLTHPW
jgi:SAM-dependent methyltransferase